MNSDSVPEDVSHDEKTMVNPESVSDQGSSGEHEDHLDTIESDDDTVSESLADEFGDGYEDDDSKRVADRRRERGPMKSLAQLAQDSLIESLSKAVDSNQGTAQYCCGGSIPAIGPHLAEKESKVEEKGNLQESIDASEEVKDQKPEGEGNGQAGQNSSLTPSVTIRWDDPVDHYLTRRVTLPSEDPLIPTMPVEYHHLIKACGGEGLDQSKFTVDFHPQDYGILDAVSQILLPGWENKFLRRFPEHRGVQVGSCRLHVSLRVHPRFKFSQIIFSGVPGWCCEPDSNGVKR